MLFKFLKIAEISDFIEETNSHAKARPYSMPQVSPLCLSYFQMIINLHTTM